MIASAQNHAYVIAEGSLIECRVNLTPKSALGLILAVVLKLDLTVEWEWLSGVIDE
jgi:hypothetical protein